MRSLLRAAAAVLVVAIGAAGFFLAGRDDGAHEHDGPELSGFTEFTAQGGDWPPQMDGIEAVRPVISDVEEDEAAVSVGDLLESDEVRTALGDRFVASGEGRSATDGSQRSVFFSHDTNTTVEVVSTDLSVDEVIVTPASSYQPPETIQESNDAADLACDALLDAGHTDVESLDGYGILAYPDDPDLAFFDHRVLYVSFHENEDSRPEFVAWVDLTTRDVVRAVPESELTP
ncbi:MAG: hypothetical protein ACERLM_09185 [Acidimicrobiales bacterium]